MCCWFPHLLSLRKSPPCIFGLQRCLLFVSFVSVFAESKGRRQQARARARARRRRPFRHKENIGQREAVSALTTPQKRLHEREILIHKAASAINKLLHNSVCLHERELLLIHKSSRAISNYSTTASVIRERELILIHKSSSTINSTRASKPAHILEAELSGGQMNDVVAERQPRFGNTFGEHIGNLENILKNLEGTCWVRTKKKEK